MELIRASIVILLLEWSYHLQRSILSDTFLCPANDYRVWFSPCDLDHSLTRNLCSPALTMNGSSTTTQYNISSNLQQRPQYQYHNLAINPAYVQGYPQTQSPVSNQQQSQTLSPYVLHGSPVMDSLNPSSFYAGTQAPLSSSPSQLTPQARQEMFSTTIRPLLQPNQFTGAGAVLDLTDRIIALGMVEMETPLRLEILTKIRDNAGNHYFRAWVENEDAMEITREWLKAAAKGDDQLAETVMPLLHVRWTIRR